MDGWRERALRRFQYLKTHSDMTQVSLAEEIGVVQSTVSMWLSGEREPDTLDLLEKLARGLKMHPAEMLYGFDMLSVDLYQRICNLDPASKAAIMTLIDSIPPPKHQGFG